ncbi:MAG: tRNA lysidine(34) synthetase TilS [Proteobacteria bacterium]|nr:tRNA lysidine(34) synthetase TilS [Pseudomonadota bacterium]
MDSSVLLDVAARHACVQGYDVSAIHVHHGLSPNADQWARHCEVVCQKLDIPLRIVYVSIDPDAGKGIESAARMARYQAFDTIDADWILLAHHRDDQAETVVLNLLRNAGCRGMAAMAKSRERYLRPFLDIPRTQLGRYADEYGLSWVCDESNRDLRLSRNFVRTEILPRLETPFPKTVERLARAAKVFAEQADLLDMLARIDMEGDENLSVARLHILEPVRARNLLAAYLRWQGVRLPSSARLDELLRQFLMAAGDRHPVSKIGQHLVLRRNGHVSVMPNLPRPAGPVAWDGKTRVAWCGGSVGVEWQNGEGLSAARILSQPLQFRSRHGGERLRLRPGGPRRPVKDLMREARIPVQWRFCLPFLYGGTELIWVAGIGADEKYLCEPTEQGISLEFDGPNW